MKYHRLVLACLLTFFASGQAWSQCNCQGQLDPNYNGIENEIGDWVLLFNITIIGIDPLISTPCACGLGDVNCDGVRDVIDIVKMLRVITGDIDPAEFCRPDESCSAIHCGASVPLLVGSDVFIESKTIPAGAQNVSLGVYLYNDRSITSILLPFEFRSITPGSYIAGSVGISTSGRLEATDLTSQMELTGYDDSAVEIGGCSGPTSGTYDSVSYTSSPTLSNPLGALWFGMSQSSMDLPAGFDGYPGNGSPSLLITFDVTSTQGQFEIDTCCWAPANHLAFIASDFETVITPRFSKGIITIGDPLPPNCTCHADPRCDGEVDVIDVVGIVNVAFGGGSATRDDVCSTPREDVDCSSVVDILDVLKMINVAFRGFDPQLEFCNP